MTSSRPYLVRAIREWVVDNGLTPQLIVKVDSPEVKVPPAYVQDGKIVLNVSTRAVRDLLIANDRVTFNARFSGKPFAVEVPIRAVMAVYAAENGVGMAFQDEPEDGGDPPAGSEPDKSPRPSLRVVK